MAGKDYGDTERDLYDYFDQFSPDISEQWRNDVTGHEYLSDFYDVQGLDRDYRSEIYELLKEHLYSDYGLDFVEWFDWESWREYYDSQ